MQPDETDEERLEQLPEDNGRPFDPATDSVNDTHPATDSNLDSTEVYQEGVDVASNTATPNGADDLDASDSDEIEDEAI